MAASITKNSVVKMGPAANNLTELNRGVALGLEGFEYNFDPSIRQVPSGDSGTHRQSLDRKDFNVGFTIDRNATARGLFLGKEGENIFFEIGADGPDSGNERLTGELLIASLGNTAGFNGVLRMALGMMINGEVDEGTYP